MTFDVDANGILSVSARDRGTGREQRISVTASTNLTAADIDRMVAEAREHAADDRRRRQAVEARNVADHAIYVVERNLRELGPQVTLQERQALQREIARVRQAMQGNDARTIRRSVEELQQAMYRTGQRVYAAAGQGRPAGEGVAEAEYRRA